MADLDEAHRATYSGKRILVTGAGGSIGSQLVMQLVRFVPQAVVALDKDENAIYELEQELRLRRTRNNQSKSPATVFSARSFSFSVLSSAPDIERIARLNERWIHSMWSEKIVRHR